MKMTKELNQLIEDIKILKEIDNNLTRIKTKKIENIIDLIDYAIEYNIIKTSEDVVELCINFPDLKKEITEKYDKKMNSSYSSNYDNYHSGGVYDRLEDAPGYGTEWNSRCIPNDITIRQTRNSRC